MTSKKPRRQASFSRPDTEANRAAIKRPDFVSRLQKLRNLEDQVLNNYMIDQDPLVGKISQADREEILTLAPQDGQALAGSVRDKYPQAETVRDLIVAEGLELVVDNQPSPDAFVYFGSYDSGVEPGPITLYRANLQPAKDLIKDFDIHWVSPRALEDVILAHELYHYYEDVDQSLYSNTKKVVNFSLGPWQRESTLICTEEIAGMAFAQALLRLDYHPATLNYLLFSSIDYEQGQAYYEAVAGE